MSTNQVRSFKITGIFKNQKGNYQNFSQVIKAIKEKDAIEKLYQNIGGHHKVKRRDINIKTIKELKE
ncbi:MAG: 50S ribosomal protein L18Ae [Promethearchaeota archaeon]